jgi:hypothetical protein
LRLRAFGSSEGESNRHPRALAAHDNEVAQEFDGQGPLLPPVQNVLDQAHQELVDFPRLLDAVHVEVELKEPDGERVAELGERLLRRDE